jgi:hypothetical protein
MTPEQEEQVRRLLADTAKERPDEASMPPAVAARMDRVLGDLVAERGRTSHDELASRRRRRGFQVLAAAAVLCLVALGGPAVLRSLTSGQADSASSGSGPATVADGGGSSGQETVPSTGPAPESKPGTAGALRALRRASLQADLRRVVAADPVSSSDAKSLTGRSRVAAGCAVPSLARGDDVVAVRLDGEPATLVLGAARDGSREADVYACDDASAPVVSARVPVP